MYEYYGDIILGVCADGWVIWKMLEVINVIRRWDNVAEPSLDPTIRWGAVAEESGLHFQANLTF
jgi:hypothetical protein